MSYYYNPLDRACKSITGAIARGDELTFRVYQEKSGEAGFSALTCTLLIREDGKPLHEIEMEKEEGGFAVTLRFNRTGLFFYHFRFDGMHFGRGQCRRGAFGLVQDWQVTVYRENYIAPDWFKGGVMYQIFPDRFFRAGNTPIGEGKILRDDWGGIPSYRPDARGKVLNNDFFGGNLNGIREKLGYLCDLGVTTVYLNPIFEARSNHRYDTGDYRRVDSLLGSDEDFDALVSDMEDRGMKLVLDGVFNHTGDDSRYFNKYGRYDSVGAYQSQDSPYADWYRFGNFPDSYESWWGIDILPAVNEASASYQDFICGEDGVLKYWLRRGIGGFRLDVADELPDFFLKKLRNAVKEENEEAIVIGEVWEDASNKISYGVRRQYLQGYELDSVMNYPLKEGIIGFIRTGDTLILRESIFALIDNYPKETLDSLMNLLGTHDTARILTVLGGKTVSGKDEMATAKMTDEERIAAKEKLKMAAVLQYTLPGVPCVYYGDETGMEGYEDPFCRRCLCWDAIDEDLHEFYRTLGRLRHEEREIFAEGEYRELYADTGCLVFERRTKEHVAVIAVNPSPREYRLQLDGIWKEWLSGETYSGSATVGAVCARIFTK